MADSGESELGDRAGLEKRTSKLYAKAMGQPLGEVTSGGEDSVEKETKMQESCSQRPERERAAGGSRTEAKTLRLGGSVSGVPSQMSKRRPAF